MCTVAASEHLEPLVGRGLGLDPGLLLFCQDVALLLLILRGTDAAARLVLLLLPVHLEHVNACLQLAVLLECVNACLQLVLQDRTVVRREFCAVNGPLKVEASAALVHVMLFAGVGMSNGASSSELATGLASPVNEPRGHARAVGHATVAEHVGCQQRVVQ